MKTIGSIAKSDLARDPNDCSDAMLSAFKAACWFIHDEPAFECESEEDAIDRVWGNGDFIRNAAALLGHDHPVVLAMLATG